MSNSTDQPGLKPLRLSDDFTPPSYEEWRKVVEAQLKGVPFEKAMITPTYEGINLQPIYREEDVAGLPNVDSMPGFDSYLRGTNPLGYVVKAWDVAQMQQCRDLKQLNKIIREELMRGLNRVSLRVAAAEQLKIKNEKLKMAEQIDPPTPLLKGGASEQSGEDKSEAISYQLSAISLNTIADMEALLDGIELSAVAIDFKVDGDPQKIAELLHEYCHKYKIDLHDLTGSITAENPIEWVLQLAPFVHWMKKHAPKMDAIAVDTSKYHNAGASAVEELAAGIASAVDLIRLLLEEELSVDDIATRIRFEFSVGSNFFMEIAKLRAARYMWANIIQAFGGDKKAQKITMHTKTSQYNKTIFDPYVNILRSTTEAFAAILGGTDSLHVDTFDSVVREGDEFSRHIARNQQLILKEETHLDALVDPAGGSWYIESLTEQLAQKAWALFQEIEGLGGMSKAHGFIDEKIKAIAALREKNIRSRKDVIVGTNMFANPYEELLVGACGSTPENTEKKAEQTGVLPCAPTRLSKSYEAMRLAVERHILETGKRPTVFLATMGTIAQYKARAEFAQGFFSAAGFKVVEEEGFTANELAATKAIKSGAEAVCICATDDMYPELVPHINVLLREAKPNICLILAGYPTDMVETYKAQGIDEFIHLRADVVDTLSRVLKKVGVAL